jgi:hypothetical protein
MGQRSQEETVITSKTQQARDRCREAKDMSKAQKGVMRNIIVEMDKEIEEIELYKKNIEDAFLCGLYKRAKKIIGENDKQVQTKIKEAKESIKMIEKDVEHGKARLLSYK